MTIAVLTALSQLANELTADPRAFLPALQTLLDRLTTNLKVEAAELYLADPQQHTLLLSAFAGQDRGAFAQRRHFAFGEGFPGLAASARASLETAQLPDDDRFLRAQVTQAGYHTFVSVPLLLPHGVLGVLCLARRTRRGRGQLREQAEALAPLLAGCLHSCLESWGEQLRGEVQDPAELNVAARQLLAQDFSLSVTPRQGAGPRSEPGACQGFGSCPSLGGEVRISGDSQLSCAHQDMGRLSLCLPIYQGGQVTGVSRFQLAQSPEGGLPTQAAAPLLWLTRQAFEGLPPLSSIPAEPVAPWLEITALGRFQVRRGGELLDPRAFKRRQAYVLLKLLILRHGRAISAEELCAALWPGDDPEQALPRLHVTLNALRRVIEPDPQRQQVIVRDGQTYAFAPRVPYRLDLEQFEALIRRADGAQGAAALDSYTQALELYRGDLLDDEAYSLWTALERDYYRELAVRSLLRMADLVDDQAHPERKSAIYAQLLSLDAYCFEAYEGLIRHLHAQGRDSEAGQWQVRLTQALSGNQEEALGKSPADQARGATPPAEA